MRERTACDDVVWQNWLSLITANNGKKKLCSHTIMQMFMRYMDKDFSGHTIFLA